MSNKFYITTPIYYVNARPHIGHAYTTLAADTIARRNRLLSPNGDQDTFFLTGTDEHGQKIERSAAAAGIPPQQFTDEVSASFHTLWKRMGITHDAFIRTTSDAHKRGAQKLFADLHARGQIYLSSYTGQYSIGEEMFVDGPPGTLGPDGKPTETVTEENFFFRLSNYQLPLLDLIESDTLHIQPEARKNEVLSFLRGDVRSSAGTMHVDNIEEVLEQGLNSNEVTVGLSRGRLGRSEAGSLYVPGALRDLSVSRSSFTWGIPVPEPAASETNQKHVIYVWLDALANYMTALGYGSNDPALFEKFWPADLHLVGKEIIRFHCVYWPAFLLAAGLPLPKAVTAHGWLLFDDSKMSKSKGNIVRAETILDAFGEHVYKKQLPDSTKEEQDLFATDVLRYFLLREIPFGQDGSFSFDALWARYDAELGSKLGNLVSRVTELVRTSFESRIPEHAPWEETQLQILDKPLINDLNLDLTNLPKTLSASAVLADACILTQHFVGLRFKSYNFAAAQNDTLYEKSTDVAFPTGEAGVLDWVMELVGGVNDFLTKNAPWRVLKNGDKFTAGNVLYEAAETLRFIAASLYPILPYSTASVWAQLGLGDIEQAAKDGELTNLQWGGLKPGTKLGPLSPIFPRADKGLAQIMIDMEAAKAAPIKEQSVPSASSVLSLSPEEPQDTNHPGAGPRTATLPDPAPGTTVGGSNALTTERVHTSHTEAAPSGIFAADTATSQIAIDDFMKVDLRVAQIVVAERIPKADKLLRLEVDLGYERRQILSGIAEWYTPEELVGRRIVIVANLAPRKMRGLESHGMLLAASAGENTKPILTAFGEDIALGSRVR